MRWMPKVISLVVLWGAVLAVILFVEPELVRDIVIPGSYLPFFLLIFLAILYTSRSLLISLTVVGGIILSTLKLMHWGLALVLLLTLVIESWYTYKRDEKIHPTHQRQDRGTGL